MTPKKFRSKDSEIGHLKRKFLTCGRGCEGKLIELKTKFKEWNDKNTGTNEITMNDLKEAGFSAWQLKSAEFSAKDLKDAGFTLDDFIDLGYNAIELNNVGFTLDNFKGARFVPEKIKEVFTLKQLKDAGFSVKYLANDKVGFSLQELSAKINISVPQTSDNRIFTAPDLVKAGFSLRQLKETGFTAEELRPVFTLKLLNEAGFNAQDLKDAGFSLKELKDAGFNAQDLKDAGFSLKELKDAGFSLQELSAKIYTSGPQASNVSDKRIFTAKELKDEFNAKDLKDAGFTASELKDAYEFKLYQLKNAGFTAKELKDAGYSIMNLKDARYTTQEIIDAGYNKKDYDGIMGEFSESGQQLINSLPSNIP